MAEHDMQNLELPMEGVGARLRNARQAAGLSRADIAARTKIAERHLVAIEEGRLTDLASRTYAIGFSRTYARALGLDESEITQAVRQELDSGDEQWARPQIQTFEPGDPARIPPSRFAWIAALAALAIVVAGLFLWNSYYDPAAPLSGPLAEEAVVAAVPAPSASVAALPAAGGSVTFTALEPNIWVKFYDASGAQLMQKQMAQGEQYTVPADAQNPMLWTARPDALRITVGGRQLPALSDKPMTMKDIPVTAAALVARPAPVALAPAVAGSVTPVLPAPRVQAGE